MTIDITIRRYEASDNRALSRIWREASLAAHPFLGEARITAQQALVESIYLPQAETWVASGPEGPLGFIGLIDAFVGGIFIAPQAQGLGIGRRLIAHGLALKGSLTLEVYAQNAGALGFYQRLGFREIARRDTDDEGLPFATIRLTSDG